MPPPTCAAVVCEHVWIIGVVVKEPQQSQLFLWPIQCSTVYLYLLSAIPDETETFIGLDHTRPGHSRVFSTQWTLSTVLLQECNRLMRNEGLSNEQIPAAIHRFKFLPTSGAHCLSNTGRMSNFEWLTQCRMGIARWVSDGFCTWSARPQKELRSRIKWSLSKAETRIYIAPNHVYMFMKLVIGVITQTVCDLRVGNHSDASWMCNVRINLLNIHFAGFHTWDIISRDMSHHLSNVP